MSVAHTIMENRVVPRSENHRHQTDKHRYTMQCLQPNLLKK